MGIEKPYLDSFPIEFISSKEGSAEVEDMEYNEALSGDGGWVYYTDKAKVIVDWDMPLDDKWGKAQGQVPSEW